MCIIIINDPAIQESSGPLTYIRMIWPKVGYNIIGQIYIH